MDEAEEGSSMVTQRQPVEVEPLIEVMLWSEGLGMQHPVAKEGQGQTQARVSCFTLILHSF